MSRVALLVACLGSTATAAEPDVLDGYSGVVIVGASWCQHCPAMEAAAARLITANPRWLRFITYVDLDARPKLAAKIVGPKDRFPLLVRVVRGRITHKSHSVPPTTTAIARFWNRR